MTLSLVVVVVVVVVVSNQELMTMILGCER